MQPGPYLPFNQPAIAAGQLTDFPPGDTSYIALRNTGFSASLFSTLNGDGTFSLADSVLHVQGGTIDIQSAVLGGSGTIQVSNGFLTLPNRSGGLGSLTQIGNIERLEVPFSFVSTRLNSFKFTTAGTLVAFHAVPEPSGMSLALIGLMLAGAHARLARNNKASAADRSA